MAVFGEPDYVPIDEAHPNWPVNPYGRSKWLVEQTLADYIHIVDLFSIHLLAQKHLVSGGAGECFNHDNGSGFSMQQVIETVGKVTGNKVAVVEADVYRSGSDYCLCLGLVA